jgi:phosphoglycolate phosphatase-like HAD superfamily hydrolase
MRERPRFSGLVELLPSFRPRPEARHVVFDFDGTLSLVRGGWIGIMLEMFLELIPPRPGEDPAALRAFLLDDILRHNGKPTFVQMAHFSTLVAERGGKARGGEAYLQQYLDRLGSRIRERLARAAASPAERERLLIRGARAMLEGLAARGIALHLVSGTLERAVRDEAEALGIAHYFAGSIQGPKGDRDAFTKRAAIDRILAEHQIDGGELVAFGDGIAEIQECKRLGGLAIAVASDEASHGSGRIDADKRALLVGSGADVVVPDYHDGEALIDALLDDAAEGAA